jgi:Predicted metal-binding, possibly nucleic acid-binding protein
MKLKEFDISFTGLKQGKHEFEFVLDDTFFEWFSYNEFKNVNIVVNALLMKNTTTMELILNSKGAVRVNCDLSSEPFDMQVEAALELLIKFGDAYNDEDDELLILEHGEFKFNIAQYIYEMVVLGAPQKRVHPDVISGKLKSKALSRLEELSPKGPVEEKPDKEEGDPRWDALKKLL